MQGYEVRTSDGDKVGRVIDVDGDYLIVEHGLLKTKHALPQKYAEIDPEDNVVRTRLPKHVIYDSPKIEDEVDREAVGRHYADADGLIEPRGHDQPDLPTTEQVFDANVSGGFYVVEDRQTGRRIPDEHAR